MKILIVDDDQEMAEMLKDFIEFKGGREVLTAWRGQDAIDCVKDQKPDLIFLDIQLIGDMDGMDVLKAAREISPETRVCMVSAYKDEYEGQSKRMGAAAFLGKPISTQAVETILKMIDGE